ncbi:Hypothetical predicted protein [Cloeon dipterum]|uniref:Poly [ADP-ribose] polymerase n=1 Tax=Cloeon dipterum TaxID=197152 RepID=A0A8S1CB43_9INSE|nr:Hypothetical predicted protein [Cloeon dipterum]
MWGFLLISSGLFCFYLWWRSNLLLQECPRGSSDFLHVETLMSNTIVGHENNVPFTDYEIYKVYKIYNPELTKRIEKTKEELKQLTWIWSAKKTNNKRILFHGSPHAKKIAEKGFDVNASSSGNMFGKGIYLTSLSSKANQYVWQRKGCPKHKREDCNLCIRTMLICRCVMGKEFRTVTPTTAVPAKYHSIVAIPTCNDSSLKFPEFVFLNENQVEPLFYIEYKILHIQNDDAVSCTIA